MTDGKFKIDESLVPSPSRVRAAKPGEPSKRCGGPLHRNGVYLSIDSFYGNKRRADGLASRCKDCERYWENANPRSHKARAEKWARKTGRKVEKAAAGYEARLRAYSESGDYEPPEIDEAMERLRRYERGEAYKR